MVEKYYNEKGQMAILISYGYGAGWSTWEYGEMAYDKRIIEDFLNGITEEEMRAKLEEYGYRDVYLGGFEGLKVEWIDKGTVFIIREYNGSEYIETFDEKVWITA